MKIEVGLFWFQFRGGNVNAVDDDQQTPLHTAAYYGNAYAVKCLLEKDADMELKDEDEALPIHLASSRGYFKYVIMSSQCLPAILFYHQVTYNIGITSCLRLIC